MMEPNGSEEICIFLASFIAYHFILKLLPIGRGGAIFTDDIKAVEWLKVASLMVDTPMYLWRKIDLICLVELHMAPEQAARGHLLLSMMPDENEDQSEDPPHIQICQNLKYTQKDKRVFLCEKVHYH